jgi:hypothetical protein
LNTDKRDDCLAMGTLVGPDNLGNRYFLDRIIQNTDSYFEAVAKNLAATQIFRETAEAGERVARQDAAPMANYIALVVVFGRLYQDNGQTFAVDLPCEGLPGHDVQNSLYSHMSGSNGPDFHLYCGLP